MAEEELRRRLRRVYDTELGKELDVATLHETLTLLHTIFDNLVKHPDEAKFRAVPADNRRVRDGVLERKGGKAWLVAAGWRVRVRDMREFWTAPDDITTQHIVRDALRERLDRIDAQLQAERDRHARAKEAEAARAALALQQYEDDRRSWQTRHEITGGTKPSVAQSIRSREEITGDPGGPVPNAPDAPGAGGHVLGGDDV